MKFYQLRLFLIEDFLSSRNGLAAIVVILSATGLCENRQSILDFWSGKIEILGRNMKFFTLILALGIFCFVNASVSFK